MSVAHRLTFALVHEHILARSETGDSPEDAISGMEQWRVCGDIPGRFSPYIPASD